MKYKCICLFRESLDNSLDFLWSKSCVEQCLQKHKWVCQVFSNVNNHRYRKKAWRWPDISSNFTPLVTKPYLYIICCMDPHHGPSCLDMLYHLFDKVICVLASHLGNISFQPFTVLWFHCFRVVYRISAFFEIPFFFSYETNLRKSFPNQLDFEKDRVANLLWKEEVEGLIGWWWSRLRERSG